MIRTPSRVWFRRARRKVGDLALSTFGPAVFRLLASTWRVELLGEKNLDDAASAHDGCILTLWHGRMILGLPHHARRGMHVLVSSSDDGELAKRVLAGFGYKIIRGSTSSGATRALREMLGALGRGSSVVVTPDGPRGPRHSMNPGVAFMARETGFAIVPIGLVCDRAWHLASWDRFTIPKPYARIAIAYAHPIHVEPHADENELDRATERVKESLIRAETRGFEHLGAGADF